MNRTPYSYYTPTSGGMSAAGCNSTSCPPFPNGICVQGPCGPDPNRLPADSMGYAVATPYTNPMQPVDDQGWTVPFTQAPTFAPPVQLNVESARRDMTMYPNGSSFRLHIPHKLSGVVSIEVIQLIVPTVASGGTAPEDGYFFLYNGLYENSTFKPQNLVSLYKTLNMNAPQRYNTANTIPNVVRTTIKDPAFTTSPEYTGPDITNNGPASFRPGAGSFPTQYAYPDFGCHSFGKFLYDSSRPVQHWERLGSRKTFYFKPQRAELEYLDFTLVDRTGQLYDLQTASPDSEWTATILVTCANT